MRVSKIKINNKEYPACFSTRVAFACEERSGSVAKELDKVSKESQAGKLKELFWLIYELLKAGKKYSELEGIETEPLISYEDMLDSVGVSDYKYLVSSVTETVAEGNKRKTEIAPPKNKETTQEK